jgi:hypothetical protein
MSKPNLNLNDCAAAGSGCWFASHEQRLTKLLTLGGGRPPNVRYGFATRVEGCTRADATTSRYWCSGDL